MYKLNKKKQMEERTTIKQQEWIYMFSVNRSNLREKPHIITDNIIYYFLFF